MYKACTTVRRGSGGSSVRSVKPLGLIKCCDLGRNGNASHYSSFHFEVKMSFRALKALKMN